MGEMLRADSVDINTTRNHLIDTEGKIQEIHNVTKLAIMENQRESRIVNADLKSKISRLKKEKLDLQQALEAEIRTLRENYNDLKTMMERDLSLALDSDEAVIGEDVGVEAEIEG